jgi:GNAT superfamily N-acetyltransferase
MRGNNINYEIKFIDPEKDMEEIGEMVKLCFDDVEHISGEHLGELIKDIGDSELAIKAVCKGKIVGYHLLYEKKGNFTNNEHTQLLINIDYFKDKIGLEGQLLCILPEFQKIGIGTAMLNFEKEFFKDKYYYIWGGFDEGLNNYGFWKKKQRNL